MAGGLGLDINWSHHKWAIFFCLVSAIGALCYGYDTIYYTGIQGMVAFARDYGDQRADGSFFLSASFLSTTASIIYVGEFLGAIASSPINKRFGRKAVFFSASVCIILGAIVQVCSFGMIAVFCVGRVLIGLGVGQFTATCLTYISEVAPSDIRGPALMMFQFMQSVAQLVGACVNQGTESLDSAAAYQIPMSLLTVLPLTMLVCLIFTPESPVWLASKPDRRERARKALVRINRSKPNYDPSSDLSEIVTNVARDRELASQSSWSSLLTDPVERRKLLYSCGVMFAQQINGIQFWYTYGVVFAQSIGVAEPFTINTIIYLVQIITVALSVVFGNRLRRRTNLLVCSTGSLLSLVAVGALGTTGTSPSSGFSRPVGIAIVVFAYINIVCYNFSIGPLSYGIASEMAVGRNRDKITGCAMATFFLTVWLMVFTSPYLYYDAGLGPKLGFVYAATTLLGTIGYTWFCVGETAGRSNREIEMLFELRVPVRKWRTYVLPDNTTMGSEYNGEKVGQGVAGAGGGSSDDEGREDQGPEKLHLSVQNVHAEKV